MKVSRVVAALSAACVGALGMATVSPAQAQQLGGPAFGHPAREIHSIYANELGVDRPTGLAYVSRGGVLVVAGRTHDGRTRLVRLTPAGALGGTAVLPGRLTPGTLAFDLRRQRLTALAGDERLGVRLSDLGQRRPPARRTSTSALNLRHPRGATYDEVDGTWYLLDSGSIVRVDTGAGGAVRRVRRTEITGIQTSALRGLALDPADGRLYVIDQRRDLLLGLTKGGRVAVSHRITSDGLRDVRGMTFAPTADNTDAPAATDLYVADAGGADHLGRVAEIALPDATTVALAVSPPTVTARLVRTIDGSRLNPPSPDTSGAVYEPASDRLVIVDSEVDEMPIFANANIWELTKTGSVTGTGLTTLFSNEPTGVAYKPSNDHLFISDDDRKKVFELARGPDGRHGTADDVRTELSTSAFGNTDLEDVTYDTKANVLYTSDGVGREIYRIAPGSNGRFDGVAPAGDDVVTHFDVQVYGVDDAEGVGYDGERDTLFVVDRHSHLLVEVTPDGALIEKVDYSSAPVLKPSGMAVAPASDGSGRMDLWITDRGIDNNSEPSENDGKVVEVTADLVPLGNRPPVVSAGADQTIVLPAAAALSGSASDDGLPNPPGAVTNQWSKVSGPGTVTFGDAAATSTTATVSTPGTYVLRLASNDSQLSASDDLTLTVIGPNGPFSYDVSVAAVSDDAEESDAGKISLSSSTLDLVFDKSNQTVGVRFAGVQVPSGASVTKAYVQFSSASATSEATSLTVRGIAADSTTTFTNATGNVSTRPRTTAAVAWVPPAWTSSGATGTDQRTPDLSSAVQEVVGRAGWRSGNALGVVISGTGRRVARAFGTGFAPSLHVEYMTGQATNTAPTVSAGPDVTVVQPDPASLSGSVSDDGLPNPPGTTTSQWSKVSGPGTVSFASTSTPATTATFSQTGDYVLRLTAGDSALSTSDDVNVTVTAGGSDRAPTAALIVSPTTSPARVPVTADASGSTDVDSTPIGDYTFTFGDGSAPVGPQAAPTTTHTYSNPGTYTVTVTVRDTGGLTGSTTTTATIVVNLVGNPGFESFGLSGWNAKGTGATLAQVSGGHSGSFAAKLTNTAATSEQTQLNDSPNWVTTTTAATYTGSIWVRADRPGPKLVLRFREYVSGTEVATQQQTITLSTAWQRVSVTMVPTSPGQSTLDFICYVSGNLPGAYFLADDAAITSQ
jgi:uncharacterized protein YjiK/PKD repeat protein